MMKAKLETITPEIAAKMLERNTANRPAYKKDVSAIAREIKEGRWKVNGDTICLNGEAIVDGQHRLLAVVESGIPIETFVIYGVPSDVFDTKDIGRRRSPADTLSVDGEIHTRALAAALVVLDRFKHEVEIDDHKKYSNAEIRELLEKYPLMRESVRRGKSGANGLMPPSVLCACHYLFAEKDRQDADLFVDLLHSGVGLGVDDPVFLLRDRLIRNACAKAKLSRRYIMALTIKAWNYWSSGKVLRQLRFRETGDVPESFPVVE